jgi:uncharacterized protein
LSKLTQSYFMAYIRAQYHLLSSRLAEAVQRIQILAGPRQVGKTTLIMQLLRSRSAESYTHVVTDGVSTEPSFFANTNDEMFLPGIRRNETWLIQIWQRARLNAQKYDGQYVLVVDEIQKIPRWSEIVKGLWDQDRANDLNMHVVLLGSSPLLIQRGQTESLAGRYEVIPMKHWSLVEMQDAFAFSIEEYIFYGGYPGAAPYIRDQERWRSYVVAALIQPSIEKDILLMTRVEKPVLLKRLFELGSEYSGQILSYTKMQGQLQDAGNTTTLAHYLDLLAQSGLLTGLNKYAGEVVRQRASSPKLNVQNTALMSAATSYTFEQAQADRSYWGRLVESTVGAHFINTASGDCKVTYWRESPHEVDFILSRGNRITCIEVKSGKPSGHTSGLTKFAADFKTTHAMVVGDGQGCDISLVEILSHPANHWVDEETP